MRNTVFYLGSVALAGFAGRGLRRSGRKIGPRHGQHDGTRPPGRNARGPIEQGGLFYGTDTGMTTGLVTGLEPHAGADGRGHLRSGDLPLSALSARSWTNYLTPTPSYPDGYQSAQMGPTRCSTRTRRWASAAATARPGFPAAGSACSTTETLNHFQKSRQHAVLALFLCPGAWKKIRPARSTCC